MKEHCEEQKKLKIGKDWSRNNEREGNEKNIIQEERENGGNKRE
jgi:hypothetical protein